MSFTWRIPELVRLQAKLVRLLKELVRLLADSRTCPPPDGFKISDSRFKNLSAYRRILDLELVRWFKPRRGGISSKGRSPLYGANNFYKPRRGGIVLKRRAWNRILVKSMLSVLSCLDTRKNQRKSRLKSPTRWVPRGRNCHAAQLAPPAAWLKQCRLGIPALRSAPDPFAGLAFMPFL